jgi:spore germination protein
MIFRHFGFALFFALFFYSMPAAAEQPKAWAYLGWWLPDSWRKAPLGELDRLLFFDLKVNGNGKITERNGWPEKWVDLRLAVKQNNTPLDLTLTLFDPLSFDQLFSSTDSTQHLLAEAVLLASQEGVAGLQLDFEIYSFVRPETITRYRSFVRELSKRLRQLPVPKNLSVFFPMGAESQLYDTATLTKVDQLVLQGYDAHWKSGKTAGPVAPLNGDEAVTWTKAVALGQSLGVTKERLMLGFPLYGYEWQVKGAKLRSETVGEGLFTTFAPIPVELFPDVRLNVQDQVKQYGASHDPVSGSSYYQYKKSNGQFFEGWFEDWWSLRQKSEFIATEQLGGIAFFLLGYDDGQLLDYFLRFRGRKICKFVSIESGKQATPHAKACSN